MKEFILEVCVDSVESALAAVNGGASRLELCANLIIGGTSPSPYLYQEIRKHSDIPIHVLLRPRFGDFCYTDAEFSILCQEIAAFRDLGANGAVIGILTPDGDLDTERLKVLCDVAKGMSLTLHRAFDVCRDPYKALEEAIDLGFSTILTSGQENSSLKGASLIGELVARSRGRIAIQAGSGVNARVIEQLYPLTGATAYHMSGKTTLDSVMRYRKENVNMGLSEISEYEIWRTEEAAVRAARNVLEGL